MQDIRETFIKPCANCEGKGKISKNSGTGLSEFPTTAWMEGGSKEATIPCPDCGGDGQVTEVPEIQ